jgi:RHS repeat-associated protein
MYDYDPIGNRQSYAQGAAAPTTYTTNNVNQYPATADPAESFLYDKDGNLTEDGDFLYSWDFENRLESVVPKSPGPGDVLLMFEYDYEMRRVRKVAYPWDDALGDWSTTPSQDIRFVYDGWNLLLELDGRDLTDGAGGGPDGQPDNAIIRKYTWGLDLSGTLHGAGGIGGLLSVEDANATPTIPSDDLRYLYLYDANGNVGQLADLADGSLDATYEFAPFGTNMIDPENASQTGPYASTNRFRFSTKYLDAEAGWSYYGYRYLDSLMGRWTSRDPIEERGGENLYVFVQNAAPGYVDSNGLVPFPPPRPPLPPHTDCGIEIHQSPLCLIGGLGGGRWGHTWITWGSGGWGETSECPDNYINDPKHQCQKDFVNNKWAVRKTLYGSIFDRMKTCANADCEDVKSCLRRYARLMNEHFHLCALLDSCPNNYHCRVFYKEALNKCCLQRSTLFFVDIFVPIRYCCSRCSQGRDIRE